MIINIGTNRGNIGRVVIKKRLVDITHADVLEIARKYFENYPNVRIIGWGPSSRLPKKKKQP